MLFWYSLLFFVLGASVVALPVSPPTFHLSRRGADESKLNGYWQGTDRHLKRIIYIEDNQIMKAVPPFSKEPGKDLEHDAPWEWATKESVAESHLPRETMAEIPAAVPGSRRANERLVIGQGKDGLYPAWWAPDAVAKSESRFHTKLILNDGAIDKNKGFLKQFPPSHHSQ